MAGSSGASAALKRAEAQFPTVRHLVPRNCIELLPNGRGITFNSPFVQESRLLARPPPCPCPGCLIDWRSTEQQTQCLMYFYNRRLTASEAADAVQQSLDTIAEAREALSRRFAHGDLIISRWRNKSRGKRSDVLQAAAPDLAAHPRWLPEANAAPSIYDRDQRLRHQCLVPWFNKEDLAENPHMLFALLHYRVSQPPSAWAAFDSDEMRTPWTAGWLDVDFAYKCIVMHGQDYGKIVGYDQAKVHLR
jgi:hypothetical protein